MTMHTKIVTILLITFVIQFNRAETIEDAIAVLTPQIINVKTRIDTITQNGRNLIIQTRRTIGLSIAEAETTIQEQLDQLDNIIEQAEQEAEQKGVDPSKCISDVSVALSDLDPKKLESCSVHQDLNQIGIQFGTLRRLKGDLSRSIGLCKSRNPQDLDGFKGCVQTNIDYARTKSGEVEQTFTTVCENAVKNASTCVEKELGELDTTISNIAHDLKQCLLRVL